MSTLARFTIRLSIDKVLANFRDGLHRSVMKGAGSEFFTIRPYDEKSDRISQVDWAASSRLSDDEFELYARIAEPDREIRVLILRDVGAGMEHPQAKAEAADALTALFAASALSFQHAVRLAVIDAGAIAETPWLRSESAFVELSEAVLDRKRRRSYLRSERTVGAYLEALSLRDTLIVCISDAREDALVTLDFAPRICGPDRNVQAAYLALDEWKGYAPRSFQVDIAHPERRETRRVDLRSGGGFSREIGRFLGRMERIRGRGFQTGSLVLTVPLIDGDPVRTVALALFARGYE